jgi:hypothetical protein
MAWSCHSIIPEHYILQQDRAMPSLSPSNLKQSTTLITYTHTKAYHVGWPLCPLQQPLYWVYRHPLPIPPLLQ